MAKVSIDFQVYGDDPEAVAKVKPPIGSAFATCDTLLRNLGEFGSMVEAITVRFQLTNLGGLRIRFKVVLVESGSRMEVETTFNDHIPATKLVFLKIKEAVGDRIKSYERSTDQLRRLLQVDTNSIWI